MTLIRFFRTRPTADGTRVPASGTLRFTPTRERVVVGDPDEVILPISFSVQVPKDTGRADVDLAPTGTGWVWEVYSHSFGVTAEYAYVVVPEPVSDPDSPGEFLPVDEPDLVRVDKDTLDPAAVPDPLWWAELEAAKALASDVELARVEAAGSATDAEQSATDAGVSAGEASASASSAAGSALSASDSATQAGTSADLANTSALSAGTALTGAESARDATVAAAGGSELSAQAAANAATDSAQSAADAEAAALNVVTRADAGEFKGDQGLPGNATMRVDTSAGARVFITDGVTERMVSGDTGWRDLTASFASLGNDPKLTATMIKVRRVGESVYLEAIVMSTDNNFPSTTTVMSNNVNGFRSAGNYDWPAGYYASTAIVVGTLSTNASIRARLVPNIALPPGLRFRTQWTTSDPWPTTLPGTPV